MVCTWPDPTLHQHHSNPGGLLETQSLRPHPRTLNRKLVSTGDLQCVTLGNFSLEYRRRLKLSSSYLGLLTYIFAGQHWELRIPAQGTPDLEL